MQHNLQCETCFGNYIRLFWNTKVIFHCNIVSVIYNKVIMQCHNHFAMYCNIDVLQRKLLKCNNHFAFHYSCFAMNSHFEMQNIYLYCNTFILHCNTYILQCKAKQLFCNAMLLLCNAAQLFFNEEQVISNATLYVL